MINKCLTEIAENDRDVHDSKSYQSHYENPSIRITSLVDHSTMNVNVKQQISQHNNQ